MKSCCTSRLGQVKKSFPDRQKAKKAAEGASQKYGCRMEPYPCYQHNGRYHIRKVRVREV